MAANRLMRAPLTRARRSMKVNHKEAARVRAIFELYLQHGALQPTVQELAHRRWRTKRRQNRIWYLAKLLKHDGAK